VYAITLTYYHCLVTGQAGALRHGVSLALTAFGENYYEVLEKGNYQLGAC